VNVNWFNHTWGSTAYCGENVVSEDEIYAGLNELFHELFADEGIVLRPETTAADIDGWDSFNNLNIMVAVETRFGIKMSTVEVERLNNIGDLVKIIMMKSK
jgi:acyl carrier protein